MKGISIAMLDEEPKDMYDALEKIGLSKKNIQYVEKADLITGSHAGNLTLVIRWSIAPSKLIPLED